MLVKLDQTLDIEVLDVEPDSDGFLLLWLQLQLCQELDRLEQIAVRVLGDLALADREKLTKQACSLLNTLLVRDEVLVFWLAVEAKVLNNENFVERLARLD